MRPRRVLVVVPTFDEAENVAPLARAVLAALSGPELRDDHRVELLFIDDASPDGTAERVRALAREDRRVRLLSRPRKLGLGTAYLSGFRAGLDEGFDLVVTMDADLSHDPAHLPALLAAAGEHDVVLGSRYVPGGGIRNWGLHRRLLSRFANALARRALALPVHDATSGFRAYRASALRVLPLAAVRSSGYSFLEEITFLAARRGLSLGEVPIVFCDRRGGRSKISAVEILLAAYRLARLSLGASHRRPAASRAGAPVAAPDAVAPEP